MKTRFATLFAVLALALGPAAFAAEQDNKPADKKEPPKNEKCCTDGKDCKSEDGKCKAAESTCEKPKRVVLTGSHIPQLITRHGRITDGINAVTVVSREDLEATGETNIAAALRKVVPAIR